MAAILNLTSGIVYLQSGALSAAGDGAVPTGVATGQVLTSNGAGVQGVWSASPTLTTSVTSPLVIGGGAVGSSLELRSTSGIGATDYIRFTTGNNGGTEAVRIIDSGNVGIGSTNPANKLDIDGATTSTLRIRTTSSGNPTVSLDTEATQGLSLTYRRADNVVLLTANNGAGQFQFQAGGGADQGPRINASGNVGIGTTTPGFPLSVNGSIGLGSGAGTLAISATAPTITSGFNTAPTIAGTSFSFSVNTGTTAATNTAVIGLPTASNGWSFAANDLSDGGYVSQVASTTTSASFKYYSRTTGLQIAWPVSATIAFLSGAR